MMLHMHNVVEHDDVRKATRANRSCLVDHLLSEAESSWAWPGAKRATKWEMMDANYKYGYNRYNGRHWRSTPRTPNKLLLLAMLTSTISSFVS